MSCSICTLRFTYTKRKPVSCPECNFSACKECLLRYFQSKQTLDIRCLQSTCSFEYTYFDVIDILGKNRTNRIYKEILFEEEKVCIEKSRNIYIIQVKQKQIKTCRNILDKVYYLQDSLANIDGVKNDLASGMQKLSIEVEDLKKNKVKLCIEENCKGYLSPHDDNAMVCNSCKTLACCRCLAKIQNDRNVHECDSNTIKNLEHIQSNTKECPCCFKKIYKIEGCNQMFCTLCKTKFMWDSLEIITSKNFHNSHFLDEINHHRIQSPNIKRDLENFQHLLRENKHFRYEQFYNIQKRLSYEVISAIKDKMVTSISCYEKKKHTMREKFINDSIIPKQYKNFLLRNFSEVLKLKIDSSQFEKLYHDIFQEIYKYGSGKTNALLEIQKILTNFVQTSNKLQWKRNEVFLYQRILEDFSNGEVLI